MQRKSERLQERVAELMDTCDEYIVETNQLAIQQVFRGLDLLLNLKQGQAVDLADLSNKIRDRFQRAYDEMNKPDDPDF
jgi:hypothetical protein